MLRLVRLNWKQDEIIVVCDLTMKKSWKGLSETTPEVVALSELLRNTTHFHPLADRDSNFRSPSAVARKSWDIATSHPGYPGKQTKGGRLDREVLRDFIDNPERMSVIASTILDLLENDHPIESELTDSIDFEGAQVREGELLLASHYARERNSTLRRKKLDQIKAAGQPVACTVCGFDFERRYGQRGSGYIEVHHTVPLHISGSTTTTKLSDLILLCANCHRMIHREEWITPDQLRAIIKSATSR